MSPKPLDNVVTGIVILLLAVFAAAGFGLYRRRVDGRFAPSAVDETPTPAVGDSSAWASVNAAGPGAVVGEEAPVVPFSRAFCAPGPTPRGVLADVADRYDGVAHLEIDAEQHLALVRELDVRRTPTTLILDRSGHEITRAAGAPRREQVLAALPHLQES